MDLAYSEEYESFRTEVQDFIAANRDRAPTGPGRGKADAEAMAWQQLLIDHGYAARTIPKEYGGFGAEPDEIGRAHV